MEYLRSKVAQTDDAMVESEEKDDGEGDDDEDVDHGPVQHTDSAYESGDRENASKTKTSVSSEDKKQSKAKKSAKQEVTVQTNVHVKLFSTAQYLFSAFTGSHLCVADGAGDGVHSEAERCPVQRERGE